MGEPLHNREPAFPFFMPETEVGYGSHGMSLRDYFAAKAMQGFLQNASEFSSGEQVATDAYLLADAMIKARGL